MLDSSGKYRVTTFTTKFPLSPHLVSWLVAPDGQNGLSSIREANIAIHGRTEHIDSADFALKAAVKFDRYLRQYFLPDNTVSTLQSKLDIVAVPNLNNNEGSATPGLITMSERFVFFDDKENTVEDKQMILLKLSKMMAKIVGQNTQSNIWKPFAESESFSSLSPSGSKLRLL